MHVLDDEGAVLFDSENDLFCIHCRDATVLTQLATTLQRLHDSPDFEVPLFVAPLVLFGGGLPLFGSS